jgi:hypothetical protein
MWSNDNFNNNITAATATATKTVARLENAELQSSTMISFLIASL